MGAVEVAEGDLREMEEQEGGFIWWDCGGVECCWWCGCGCIMILSFHFYNIHTHIYIHVTFFYTWYAIDGKMRRNRSCGTISEGCEGGGSGIGLMV